MRTKIPTGGQIQFTSGDVTALGTIEAWVNGRLFVRADRPVPVMLGKGTPLEAIVEGGSLWIDVENATPTFDRDGCFTGIYLEC